MNPYKNFFETFLVKDFGDLVLTEPENTDLFKDREPGVYKFSKEDFQFNYIFNQKKFAPTIALGDALLPEEERTLIVFSDPLLIATEDKDLIDQLITLNYPLIKIIKRPGADSYLFKTESSRLKLRLS